MDMSMFSLYFCIILVLQHVNIYMYYSIYLYSSLQNTKLDSEEILMIFFRFPGRSRSEMIFAYDLTLAHITNISY